MTITPSARDAMLAAADWLELNPTHHITGDFALDAEGLDVSPTDPTATCFCALGRIAKEAGIEMATNFEFTGIRTWFAANGLLHETTRNADDLATQIYVTNDLFDNNAPNASLPPVIPMLRLIAMGEPTNV